MSDDRQPQGLWVSKLEDQIPGGNHRLRCRCTRRRLRRCLIVGWRIVVGSRKVRGLAARIRKGFESTIATENFLEVPLHLFISVRQIALNMSIGDGGLQGPHTGSWGVRASHGSRTRRIRVPAFRSGRLRRWPLGPSRRLLDWGSRRCLATLRTLLLTLLPTLGSLTEEIVEFIAHDGCDRFRIGDLN